jgi:hypothetical protein
VGTRKDASQPKAREEQRIESHAAMDLSRPPMVRKLFVIEVPDASDKRMVTVHLCPIDCFFLSFGCVQHMVLIGFDHIIVNGRPFRAALGTCFYVNVRH